MKWLVPAIAIAAMAACNPAWAQTPGDILQRLEALEQSNADLKKENAALRDRVRRVESARQTAPATPAPAASPSANPNSAYASAAPVYKAAPMEAPRWSWTGFYVGAHGGYASGRATGPDLAID